MGEASQLAASVFNNADWKQGVNMSDNQAELGLVGLAVMGRNLALNIARSGRFIQVYNRTPDVTESMMKDLDRDANVMATHSGT